MPYILSFLNSDSYQVYNREIARLCKSVNAAIMLSELIGDYQAFAKSGQLASHEKHGPGWFYLTVERCEERTCLSKVEQANGLKILKQMEFIEQVEFGLPCRRYFKLNEEKILNALGLSKNSSSKTETVQLDRLKPSNHVDGNSPTAPIYKEPKEEPYLRQTDPGSVGLSEKEEDKGQSLEKLYYKTKSYPYASFKSLSEINQELAREGYTQAQIDEVIAIFREEEPRIGGKNIVKYLKAMLSNKKEENKWAYRNTAKKKDESESIKQEYTAKDMQGRPFLNWRQELGLA